MRPPHAARQDAQAPRAALRALALAALHALAQGAGAATLSVGPAAPFASVAAAAKAAQDGDTIEIAAGTYREDVAVFTQRHLAIRGTGGRVVLDARGTVAEGKAIWVFRDGDYTIDGIDFRGARADDRNGAGIRFERGRLTVRDCTFFDNENGILTGNDAAAELVVEDSEFGDAPRDRGSLKHFVYVGTIARFTMTGSRASNGFEGHLVKSRARVSDVRYNLLYDGAGGRAAYELEFPNGGVATVVGNVIGQSAETTNPVVVAYGAEGPRWPDNALYLAHNTLVSDRVWGAWFLRVFEHAFAPAPTVVAVNNLTVGWGLFALGAPGTFAGNRSALSWALGDLASLDFTLGRASSLRAQGAALPAIGGVTLAPTAEFRLPRGTRAIEAPPRLTPGAFQTPGARDP